MCTIHVQLPGINIACSNCCEVLSPETKADPECFNENYNFENRPIYELTQGGQVVAISCALERIYRYEKLRDLNDSEEELVRKTPLCQNCANILNQMVILHQEFDRLRGLESFLSTKIYQVDEIIRDGIVNLKCQQITKEHAKDDEQPPGVISGVVVKPESEEPSETILSSGPWDLLEPVKHEALSGDSLALADPEEDTNIDPLGDNGSNYFPEMDFEAHCTKEVSKIDIPFEGVDEVHVEIMKIPSPLGVLATPKIPAASTLEYVGQQFVTGDALICSVCGKRFQTRSAKSQHKSSHQPPTPCPMCGIHFGTTSALIKHQRKYH